MDNDSKPDKQLEDEAKAYVDSLPDETAAGRLVTDAGTPADTAAWEAEEARQRAAFKDANPGGTDDPA